MQSPLRGSLYRLKSDPAGKPRPVVVVSRTQLNAGLYVLVVPFTTQNIDRNRHRPNYVLFEAGDGGLAERSHAKCGEIAWLRISDLRISDGPLGEFDDEQMSRLVAGLKYVLEID